VGVAVNDDEQQHGEQDLFHNILLGIVWVDFRTADGEVNAELLGEAG
jgi:hypothetical protein